MFPGYVPDRVDAYLRESNFYAGEPRKSWFGSLKINKNVSIPIRAYRGVACGFMEFYASEQFRAQ